MEGLCVWWGKRKNIKKIHKSTSHLRKKTDGMMGVPLNFFQNPKKLPRTEVISLRAFLASLVLTI